jgi:hypothetical protein
VTETFGGELDAHGHHDQPHEGLNRGANETTSLAASPSRWARVRADSILWNIIQHTAGLMSETAVMKAWR